MKTALIIRLKTDTDLLVIAKFTSEANRVVGIDINAYVPGKPNWTPWSLLPGENYSRCFIVLARTVRNAAILWKGCNDRLDRGERDSHSRPEYEAICETIREGIAALIDANPQMNYQQERYIVGALFDSIVTDLAVFNAEDLVPTA